MAMIPVLVVRQLFSWPLGHDSHGQHVHVGSIIDNADDMAYALAQHPEKAVPAMHDRDVVSSDIAEQAVIDHPPFDE